MHSFTNLMWRVASNSLGALNEWDAKSTERLAKSGATTDVKNVQAVILGKAVVAVGVFSLFEARLQDALHCESGFAEALYILDEAGETALKEEFSDFQRAINVLKHGEGRSYNALVAKADKLSFRVIVPGEALRPEYDVAGVDILIDADDEFVRRCASIVHEVAELIEKERPGTVL